MSRDINQSFHALIGEDKAATREAFARERPGGDLVHESRGQAHVLQIGWVALASNHGKKLVRKNEPMRQLGY